MNDMASKMGKKLKGKVVVLPEKEKELRKKVLKKTKKDAKKFQVKVNIDVIKEG